MTPISIDAFFSCSFSAADKPINDHFMAIARALGMRLGNVSTGSAATPPEVAKSKISSSQALLAVCTNREEYKSGKFSMPQAVHDEISFAYGAGIPVLMIVEEGVQLEGCKSNFGTYLPFQRDKISDPDILEKCIEAIHNLKMEVVEPHQLGSGFGMSEAIADYVHHFVELKCDAGRYEWSYATSKRLTFTKSSKRGFSSSAWCMVPGNLKDIGDNQPISFDVQTTSSSRGIKIVPHIETQSAEKVDAILKLDPTPDEGDYIEYITNTSSRYLNPVWIDEILNLDSIHLDEGDYSCADGLVLIHRTKQAILEFRFPREYGFRRNDVVPFVASYSSSIDYEVPSELERAHIKIDEFGGNLIVRMELTSPLPGHLYGIAWNPKIRN